MRVKIGPHINWWGPYQIADLLFGNPDKYVDEGKFTWRHKGAALLGEWLAHTKFADFCQWVHDKRQRQVYVHIDNYDVWNMDSTLNLIIAPMFKRLKETKHGFGFIQDEDVPEHLRSTHAPAVREHVWDCNAEKRYEWLLDELIWVFSTDHEEAQHSFYDYSAVDNSTDFMKQVRSLKVDYPALEAYQKRIQKAYELFGKYYQTFWD